MGSDFKKLEACRDRQATTPVKHNENAPAENVSKGSLKLTLKV